MGRMEIEVRRVGGESWMNRHLTLLVYMPLHGWIGWYFGGVVHYEKLGNLRFRWFISANSQIATGTRWSVCINSTTLMYILRL